MAFSFERSLRPASSGLFEYRSDEYSIGFRGHSPQSSGGVLINDLALEMNEDGEVVALSGLCPHTLWRDRTLRLPSHIDCRLIIKSDSKPQPGVYRRLNVSDYWPIFVDRENALLCVGDPDTVGEAGCFLPGAVLVLQLGSPRSLWLFEVAGLR